MPMNEDNDLPGWTAPDEGYTWNFWRGGEMDLLLELNCYISGGADETCFKINTDGIREATVEEMRLLVKMIEEAIAWHDKRQTERGF